MAAIFEDPNDATFSVRANYEALVAEGRYTWQSLRDTAVANQFGDEVVDLCDEHLSAAPEPEATPIADSIVTIGPSE